MGHVNFRTFILLKEIGDHLMPENTAKGGKPKTLDPKDVESFITDPWANADKAPLDILDNIVYPDLKGMEVMLINPNCYYRI